jgi:probable phosphoglycerate mutase
MAHDYQAPFSLPAGATEVILVRHGSSGPHTNPLIGGRNDPPLTPLGRDQADALSQRLGALPITSMFVTPLRRTMQTAAPLAAMLRLDPVVVPEFSEVYLGILEAEGGLQTMKSNHAELRTRVLAEESWSVIPEAEAMESLAARVGVGLERAADETGPDRLGVAIVHGGVIAEACRQITGSRPFAFFTAENCGVTHVVRTSERQWLLQSYNDTSHLKPALMLSADEQ